MSSTIDRRRRLLLATSLSLCLPAAHAGLRPLEIGIMPYLPTATLISGHQPLRRHLEATLSRDARLSSAPDFPTFHRRTLAGDYDLVITGPPLAWHAHQENKMTWIAVSDRVLRILFLVPNDSPIQRIEDLGGRSVATIDPMTITAQVASATLREHRLEPGRDVIMVHRNSPANAAQATLLGDAAATAFPSVSLPGLPIEMRRQFRPIHESHNLPSVAFLARNTIDLPTPGEMQAILFHFARETAEGKEFLRQFNHDGLHAPDLKAMRILDQYLPELRRQLAKD